MSTHTASQTATAEPARVLQVLTDPAACARWAPIQFSTDQASDEYLHAGSRAVLQGRIAGRNVTFEIDVLAADERGLSLRAAGPVRLEVDYQLTPSVCGTLIEARITLAEAGGITGALASHATNAILGAGALRFALRAIAAEAEQLQQGVHGYYAVDSFAGAIEDDLGHRRNAAMKELTNAVTRGRPRTPAPCRRRGTRQLLAL